MALMAKDKRKEDRHKSEWRGKLVRFHPQMWEGLEELTSRNTSDITAEIRIAVRERLEKFGLWPPSKDES